MKIHEIMDFHENPCVQISEASALAGGLDFHENPMDVHENPVDFHENPAS